MIDDLELLQRLRRVRMIALDVDGVLTERGVFVAPGGEVKRFDIQDGLGIVIALKAGLKLAIVSGRASDTTTRRAAELGIEEVHQGIRDKRACLQEVALRQGVAAEEILFIGDDLPDLSVMKWCGISAAPADANAEVLSRVSFVAHHAGGCGAVREVIEYTLKAQDSWTAVLEAFLR